MGLNADQRRALLELKTGRSFAVFGAAGTGKSVVRDRIAQLVPSVVIGPTGMSMAGSGGMTVARFLGAKPSTIRNPGALARSMRRVPHAPGFTVIIDEAPMVATVEIIALDRGLKLARRSSKPFGGVRVVIFGDFCQLAAPAATTPLFLTAPYKALKPDTVVLKQQMRQTDDPVFAALLDDCRRGQLSTASANVLLYTLNAKTPPDGVLRLYATRNEAARWNQKMLKRLPAPQVNGLRVGARVVVTRNIYVGSALALVNGDVGDLTALTARSATISVRGRSRTLPMPAPLGLAYALTIHKSQGQTYDAVTLVGTNIFAAGQVYTALSRARSLAGVYCVDVMPEHAEIKHPQGVYDFLADLQRPVILR